MRRLIYEKHNMKNTSIYRLWSHIKGRCEDPKDISYPTYGGSGIKMCEEWSGSFINFYNDMGSTYKKGHHIDRIDGTKGYSKDNCRFVTRNINNANRSNYGEYMRGVTKNKKCNSFVASIRVDGVRCNIGSYATEVEAHEAFMIMHKEWYGF